MLKAALTNADLKKCSVCSEEGKKCLPSVNESRFPDAVQWAWGGFLVPEGAVVAIIKVFSFLAFVLS